MRTLKGLIFNVVMVASIFGLTLTAIPIVQFSKFQDQISYFEPLQQNPNIQPDSLQLEGEIESLNNLIRLKDTLYAKMLNNSVLILKFSCFLFHVIFWLLFYQKFFKKTE